MTSASETFFPPLSVPLNAWCTSSSVLSTLPRSAGSFTAQKRCGARRTRAPFRAATFVGTAECRGRCPRRRHELRDGETGRENSFLQFGDVAIIDQRMIACRNRVLPQQRFRWHERAEVKALRSHVAVRELEPRARKEVGEELVILVQTAWRFRGTQDRHEAPCPPWTSSVHGCAWDRAHLAPCPRRRLPWAPTAAHRPGS
jgi:hypothetical protein